MRSIKQIKNLKGKIVLLRVDFNVPIKQGKIVDDFRIVKSLPTIEYLLDKGAEKIILITHLGKTGEDDLTPVKERFYQISGLPESLVYFFDNVRKFHGEETNDISFAKTLSFLGDIYVNDAFSVSHRNHASLVSLPKILPHYAGFQLENEIKNLSQVFEKPKKPFVFILGGAKFSTKIPLLKKYLSLADYVFVGGALANDLLKAKGYRLGKSLVDNTNFNFKPLLSNKKLIIPIDVKVQTKKGFLNKKVGEIKKDEFIVDIGEETLKNLTEILKDARMILWNGPLGKYEEGGKEATKKIMKILLKSEAKIIIGGGDLVSCFPKSELVVKKNKLKSDIFISTGGGATLDFLVNKTLPAIKVLK